MHIKMVVLVGTALLAFAAVAARAEDADEPKGYSCVFTTGTASSFKDGAFISKAPEPLSFTITAIDLDKQTAQLNPEGSSKPGSLTIVRAINANHFLEVVNEGFLNLTTVYDKDAATGLYPAVHSRHFGLLGQPVIGQYVGTCRAK
jgi:hypothetical protein